MIQTYGKSGRPLDADGEPDSDPLGVSEGEVVGPTVGGADGLGGPAGGEGVELGPDPQPDTARATSHTNARVPSAAREPSCPPFAAYPLRPPPNNVPKTPRMMSCPRRELATLPPVRIAVSIVR